MTKELKDALKNEAKEVTNKVKNAGEKATETVKGLGEGIKKGFDKAGEKTNQLTESVKEKFTREPKKKVDKSDVADMILAIGESNISDDIKKEIIMFITNHRK